MKTTTANLIIKLYNNYNKDYNNCINNLDLNKAKILLNKMVILDDVIKKYQC